MLKRDLFLETCLFYTVSWIFPAGVLQLSSFASFFISCAKNTVINKSMGFSIW